MNIAGAIEYLSAGLYPVTDEHLTEARLAVSDMANISGAKRELPFARFTVRSLPAKS